MIPATKTAHKSALKVAVLYATFSLLWIAFSDQILLYFVKDAGLLTKIQMVKGWAFVIVTAFLVYFLLRRELTIAKQVENTLRDREKRLSILFDQAADAMFVSRLDGQLTHFNQQACSSTGYSPEEMARLNVIDIDADIITVDDFKAVANTLAPGVPITIESRHRTKDGTIFPVEITISLLDTPDGPQAFGIARDITVRKKLFEERGRAEQLAALGTVAAGVAHEINNPINGIINYAELLRAQNCDRNRTLELAQRITKESERIAKITEDLLHYSKDSRDEIKTVDMKELIEDALSLIIPKIRPSRISVEAALCDHAPNLMVNPQSIQQVILNLVDNAYYALKDKGVSTEEKRIKVCSEVVRTNGKIQFCIEVADNGAGMSQDVAQKAKDAFFSTKPSAEGTGLGLSIVNEIVCKHHGEFDIESKEGEYTKVTILLPFADEVV